MKSKILKKSVSILIIFSILLNIIPNFGLLKKVAYAADSAANMIIRNGVEDFETIGDSKIFKLNVYLKNIDLAGFAVYLKYPFQKMTPCDASGNVINTTTEPTIEPTEVKKAIVCEGVCEVLPESAGAFIINTNTGEFGAAFTAEKTVTEEELMCTILFKVTDNSLNISDISSDDFKIGEYTDEYCSQITDAGNSEIWADSDPGCFAVEPFNFTPQPTERKVTAIAISGTGVTKTYKEGDTLDIDNITVTKTYSIGDPLTDEKTLTEVLADTTNYEVTINDIALIDSSTLNVGDVLKVTYKGTDKAETLTTPAEANLNVTKKQVTGIEIRNLASSYKQGTEVNLSDNIYIIYDGDTANAVQLTDSAKYSLTSTGNTITDGKITLTNPETTTVTITYTGDDAQEGLEAKIYEITVVEKVVESIAITEPTTKLYKVGDTLNLSGLTVTATYDTGDTVELAESDYTIDVANNTELTNGDIGVKTITVKYNKNEAITATFDVVVFPNKLVGTEGQTLTDVTVAEGFSWENDGSTIVVGANNYNLQFTNGVTTESLAVEVLGIPSNLTATYGQTLADVTLPEGKGFSWADTTTPVGAVGEQSHNITYTGYTGLQAKVNVAKKAITLTIGNTSSVYGESIKTLTVEDLVNLKEGSNLASGDTISSLEITLSTVAGTGGNTNAGDYEITGTSSANANYQITFETGTYTIEKADLKSADFDKTIPENKEYDGTASIATANVKSTVIGAGGTVTIEYYKDDVLVTDTTGYGTYTVKVNVTEGTNYKAATGIVLGSFSITKTQLTLEDIDFTAPNPNTYDGNKKEATVEIKSTVTGAGTISATKYYKGGVVTDPIDAGEYTVKITTTGATNYDNVTDMEVGTFTIEKAEPTYTLPTRLTATYGDELSSVTLPAGFTWEDSGKVGDAGTRMHTVKYTPTDPNYKEKTGIDVSVEVGKANLKDADFELNDMPTGNTKEYDGDSVTVTSKIKDAIPGAGDIRNKVTVTYYKKEDRTESNEAPSDYGTYEVRVSVVEGNNYNAVSGRKVGEFSITPATLDIAEIKVENPNPNVYDGTPKTPIIEIPDGGGTVKDIKYYKDGTTTEVQNPTDAGQYRVEITTENATNYADITTFTPVGTFEIAKADIPVDNINVTPSAPKTYDGKPSTATATLDETVPGATDVTIDVTYVDEAGNEVQNPTDAGTYTIKVSSIGGANYKSLSERETTETIEISKVTLSKDDIQCTLPESLVYDNTSKKATIAVVKDLGEGRTLTVDTNDIIVKYEDAAGTIVANPTDAGTYTIKVKVNAGTNYEALTETLVTTYEIEKATLTDNDFTISGIPDGGSKQHNGTAVTVTAPQKAHITETLNTEVQYYALDNLNNALVLPDGEGPSAVGTYVAKLKLKTEPKNYKADNDIILGQFTITPENFDPNKIKYTNTAEYDGTNKDENTVGISIDGDLAATITNVTFKQNGTLVDARNVGTYEVYADITTTESGHVGVTKIGNFEITPATVKITIGNATNEYGKDFSNAVFEEQEGFVDNKYKITEGGFHEEVTLTYSSTEKTAGEHENAIIGIISGTNNDYNKDNYKVTITNGKYTITQKPITVQIRNKDSVYGKTIDLSDVGLTLAEGSSLAYEEEISDLGITLIRTETDKTTETTKVDVGNYDIIIKEALNQNYKVEFEKGTYTITKATLTPDDFNKENIPTEDVPYNGTPVDIEVNYRDGITTTDAGAITVKYYKDGAEVETPTAVGTYIVKVSTPGGTNYFAADKTEDYDKEIKLGEFSITKSTEPFILTGVTFVDKTVTYNGEKQTITVTGEIPEGVIVSYEGNEGTDAGTYDATATFTIDKTSELYTQYDSIEVDETKGNTLTATLTIDQKDPKDDPEYEADLKNLEYEEPYKTELSNITPTGSKGTYAWKTPTDKVGNVGTQTHKVIYTPTDTNYKAVEIDANITVTPIDPEYNLGELTATYGDTLADVELPTANNGTFTWNDASTTSVGDAGRKTFKVTFTPEDTTNYNTLTDIDAIVVVAQKDPDYEIPTGLEGYEGQPLSSIDITAHTGFSWTNADTIIPLIKDKGDTFNTTMTFTPEDTKNYKTVENIPIQVRVKENEIKAIRVTSRKEDGAIPEYYEGQTFNRNDIKVEAEWAIGGWQTVTDYTITDETRKLATTDEKMVINYADKTAEQAIKVKADYVTGITITDPDKLTYNYGDEIDLTGATVTKAWASRLEHENDTTQMTKEMLSIAGKPAFDFSSMNEIGPQIVTVTVDGIESKNTFTITVNDIVTGIEVKDKDNLQKIYQFGTSLNYNYMNTTDPVKVTVTYGSKDPEEILLSACKLTGYNLADKTKIGQTQTVTVTYEEQTDTFEVMINDYVEEIKVTKYKAVYDIGDSLTIQEVIAKMASGAENTVTDYTTSGFDSTTPGTKTVTVTSNGKTAEISVIIRNKVEDMYIEKLPSQISSDGTNVDKTIPWGTALSGNGGTIIVKDAENPTGKEISMTDSSVTIEGYNPRQLGTQTVTVKYTYDEITDDGETIKQSKTATFSVTVEDYWDGKIEITPPTKTTYDYNEPLNLAGGKVGKVMASGAREEKVEIAPEMVSGYNPKQPGTQTITVAYAEKTATFNVTVVDKTLGISMKEEPNKTEYTQGQAIDVSGAVLNVTKSSGTKEIAVTKEMISGYDPNKTGTQIVTVTYDGKQTQFVVNVKPKTTTKPTNPTRPTNPVRPTNPTRPTTPSTSKAEKYTVTFVDYDGTVLKEEVVERGKSATAPELEKRAGYKFIGWDKVFDKVEEDITVTAKYEKIKRAKVNGSVTVEQGEKPNLSDVTIEIFDEEGEKLDEIPVTEDMISGYDPNKTGTQTVTVTYVGEDGYKYTDTLKIKVVKPAETLGVKDEFVETKKENMPFVPVVAGVGGVAGLLLALLAVVSGKNVEIYALAENRRRLIGKQNISKNNPRIVLDEYASELANANIEIVLKKNITKKLDDEIVSVVFNGRRSTYKVQYANNEGFTIRMKNVD